MGWAEPLAPDCEADTILEDGGLASDKPGGSCKGDASDVGQKADASDVGQNALETKVSGFAQKASGSATFGTLSLEEPVAERLRAQHVGNELMTSWASREQREQQLARRRKEQVACQRALGSEVLPFAPIRACALQFMQCLLKAMSLPMAEWFTAATVFDLYCRHLPADRRTRSLPRVCAAIVRLVKKNYDATTSVACHDWSHMTAQMVAWLTKLGCEQVDAPSVEEIEAEERSVLTAMDWQVSPSTIYSWLFAFCTRLECLTHGRYTAQLKWAWDQGQPRLVRFMPVVCFAEVAPRHLACGLLSLLLCTAGLLDFQDLRPPELGENEWFALWRKAVPDAPAAPVCALGQDDRLRFVDRLHEAAGSDAASLPGHCLAAARALEATCAADPVVAQAAPAQGARA